MLGLLWEIPEALVLTTSTSMPVSHGGHLSILRAGEARRILKREGYLFISVPFQNGRHLRRDKDELWLWDENFDKKKGYTSKMRFYQWRLTKPELEREFEINGFKALRVEAIDKWRGLHRAVKHALHIEPGSKIHRIMQELLYPFVPKDYVAHMLMGVGQKR